MTRARIARAAHGEDGFAVMTVLLATLALMILATAAVGYGLGSQDISRHDENWNGALAAANAGVDDFVFRLNQNSNYYATIPQVPNATAWTAVAGGTSNASFRYSILDPTELQRNGTVTVLSSGKVGNAVRTIQATLRRRSFIDYLYFTDFETADPSLYPLGGSSLTPSQAQAQCAHHYYDGRGSSCVDISFGPFDVINGPLHSNDAYLVCPGAQFLGATSTSWTGANGKLYRPQTNCGSGSPVFAQRGDPHHADPLTMPPSNTAIKNETRVNDGVGGGGCLYTGPTAITFNSNGTMTVKSPFSINTMNGCPTNGTGQLPSNGVIYVQNVPAASGDPNFTSGCPYSVSQGGSNPKRNHPLGYPIANDVTTYGCRNGDAFVQGTLKGQATVAAENNVEVIGNLLYAGGLTGTDMLGLAANNFVEVYHPVNSSGTDLSSSFSSCQSPTSGPRCVTMDAAMISVNHSVRVQNYDQGSGLGTLTINGAFAQRFRGIVGTFSGSSLRTGYAKQYVYDQRLKYLSPPKFIDPVAAAWQPVTWAEQKPAWCGAPAYTTACS